MRSRSVALALISAVLLAEMPTKSSANEGYLINDPISATKFVVKLKSIPDPANPAYANRVEYCKTAKINGQLIFAPTKTVQDGCLIGFMKFKPRPRIIK